MPSQQYPALDWEEIRKRAVDLLRWRFARDRTPADWEDMAQEAVLKTIIALANDRVDMQRFDPWFYTVVQRVAIDWWHLHHGREVPLPETYEPEDTRVDVEMNQLLDGQEVEALLASLQPHERLALKLKYWHDLTNREIAAVFGETVPVGTVGAWIARALQKLRVSLRRT